MECDDASVERQKLVPNDEEDDQATITNLSSSGQAKSIQTPISPVLSNKIFSSGETTRSHNSTSYPASLGKTAHSNEAAPATRLNYVNERPTTGGNSGKGQSQLDPARAKPKKVQREHPPSNNAASASSNISSNLPPLTINTTTSNTSSNKVQSSNRLKASSSASVGGAVVDPSTSSSLSEASSSRGGVLKAATTAAAGPNNSSSISLHKTHSFSSRPLKHHSFISEVPDVRHMERALLGLLEDFHSGKLKAFGSGCTMEQMTSIREQQESLAKLHFDLGNESGVAGSNVGSAEVQSQNNMKKLVAKLEQLSFSIEKLHSSKVES